MSAEHVHAGEGRPVQPVQEEGPGKNRRKALLGLALFFLACGALWAVYWQLFAQGKESTDNAYVAGNQIRVSARVGGNVAAIDADNYQRVAMGQVLVRLDATDAELALERAKSALAEATRRAASLKAESVRLEAVLEVRDAELAKA
ncbi:MAG: biotin/lipoyl-binding protein, partial [Deltaproteobacteria bacterium]|nr:biotin/lipoyl-binding protein [Deltaproteobacteria bacterium]